MSSSLPCSPTSPCCRYCACCPQSTWPTVSGDITCITCNVRRMQCRGEGGCYNPSLKLQATVADEAAGMKVTTRVSQVYFGIKKTFTYHTKAHRPASKHMSHCSFMAWNASIESHCGTVNRCVLRQPLLWNDGLGVTRVVARQRCNWAHSFRRRRLNTARQRALPQCRV